MTERVWDRFLTEQDKAHLKASPHRAMGFGTRPALVLIDLYRAVFGDRRESLLEAIKTFPASCGPAAWDAIPHTQRLLGVCREAGMPIVHVTMLVGTGVNGWSVLRGSKPGAVPDNLKGRSDLYEIIPEVAPLPGETVIRKAAPSAFSGTPLLGHLNFHDIDTLILCGESTSGCVRASVVDARANRFRVVLAEECVFDRHQAAHAMNLFDMDQKYGDVLPLAEIERFVRTWRAQRGGTPAGTKTLAAAG